MAAFEKDTQSVDRETWLSMVGGDLSETSYMKNLAAKYFPEKKVTVEFRIWTKYKHGDLFQDYIVKCASPSTKVSDLKSHAQCGMQQPCVAVGLYRSDYEGKPCTPEEEWEWLYEGGAMTSPINPKNGQLLRGDLTIGEQMQSGEEKLVFKPICPETSEEFGY